MKVIKIKNFSPSSVYLNNSKNNESKLINFCLLLKRIILFNGKSFYEETDGILYYEEYKFYKCLTNFLLIIIIPIIIISIIITKKISIKKVETLRETRFNYLNRKINSIIKEQKLFKTTIKSFNLSSKNIPKFPSFEEEHIINKPFSKTFYDKTNIRYNFEDLFDKRKLFLIDYSDDLYQNINKSLSFDDNGRKIFESSGMLNITKLEYYYYSKNTQTENLNHIHIGMAFDSNYILLSSISIVSILNTSSKNTYINFHIVLNNCSYDDIKPIISLEKINTRVSFIFYNGKQAEYDFIRGLNERRGIGEYSRLLIPEIVNNTNKILILDSADILAIKDLSEIFFFELGNYYYAFSLENIAGRFTDDFIFSRNNFYANGGVTLLNIRKFREDKLYKRAFSASITYEYLPCPFQDILLMISNYNFKMFPLNFNCVQFYKDKEKFIKDNFQSEELIIWMNDQKLSPFKYSKEELVNAAMNPIIIHLYKNKPYYNAANKEFTNIWINYAKMTDLFEKIKKNYPKPFKKKDR